MHSDRLRRPLDRTWSTLHHTADINRHVKTDNGLRFAVTQFHVKKKNPVVTRVLMTAWDGTRVLKAWNSPPAEIKSY